MQQCARMNPDQYCQDKAAKSGSSFYYSFLFLPKERRLAITALYAFCREVDDVVDESTNADVAMQTLNWWRDEIANCFDGKATHPVTRALESPVKTYDLPKKHFLEIIEGMSMDLHKNRYADFDELKKYCYCAASAVGLLAVRIFGFTNPKTLDYAHDLGIALQLTNILRDVREDFDMGRIYLPADEIRKFAVDSEDFGRTASPEACRQLFAFQAKRAEKYYHSAFAYLPEEDRYSQRSGLIMATIYAEVLNEIVKDNYPVLEYRIKLTPLRKLWLAWSAARREKKRWKKLRR